MELSYFEYCLFVEGKKVALLHLQPFGLDEKMMKILMFWDVADAATFLRLLFVMREETLCRIRMLIQVILKNMLLKMIKNQFSNIC